MKVSFLSGIPFTFVNLDLGGSGAEVAPTCGSEYAAATVHRPQGYGYIRYSSHWVRFYMAVGEGLESSRSYWRCAGRQNHRWLSDLRASLRRRCYLTGWWREGARSRGVRSARESGLGLVTYSLSSKGHEWTYGKTASLSV